MKTARITYKGIARGASEQQIEDGYLEELINLRHRSGKLTTIGDPYKD